MKSLLLITIGISGSGKNHLKNQLESYFKDDFLNIEPDNIRREKLGDVSDQSHGKWIFDLAGEQIFDACGNYKIIYFNATNTSWSRIQSFLKKNLLECDVIYVIMMDSMNLTLCQKRVMADIENGADRAKVPAEIVERQYVNFMNCKRDAENSDDEIFLYDNNFGKLVTYIEEYLDGQTIAKSI